MPEIVSTNGSPNRTLRSHPPGVIRCPVTVPGGSCGAEIRASVELDWRLGGSSWELIGIDRDSVDLYCVRDHELKIWLDDDTYQMLRDAVLRATSGLDHRFFAGHIG